MGDEQDALSFFCETFHDIHEFSYFLNSQYSGRLIENQDFVVAVEHLEDFGSLLHTYRDILNDCVRVNGQVVFLRELHDLLACLILFQKETLSGFDSQDDIVKNREAFDQLEVLVYHTYAEIVGIVRVPDFDLLTVF